MGYSAHYTGEFTFSQEINRQGIVLLTPILGGGADLRESKWRDYLWSSGVKAAPDLHRVDLEFNDDFTGLKYTESGNSISWASMVDAVKLVTDLLRSLHPDIKLQGSMEAVGEDGERWKIVIDEAGIAKEVRGKVVYDE